MTFYSNLDFNKKTPSNINNNPENISKPLCETQIPIMNPSKNYNANPRWSSVTLVTPVPLNGVMSSYLPCRSREDRTRDIKKYKNMGVEENIIGYCGLCDLQRPYTKKSASNVHYNCLKRCCKMLHQWDICEYCFIDKYGPKTTYKDQSRRDEVARFHHVFSQLPDDLKKYIGEYVPLIFKYVESVSRLVFVDRKLANLDQYVLTRPKSAWKEVTPILSKTYRMVNKMNKSSSRQQICNGVKELYQKIYVDFRTSLIEESDFWTHKKWWGQRRNTSVELIQKLENVKLLL